VLGDEENDFDTAVATFGEVVALWYVDRVLTAEIVLAACDVLAAGADGPSLRMLAAVSIPDVRDEEVVDVLEAALREVGLPYAPKHTAAARTAGLIAIARRTLSGIDTPHELTHFARHEFRPASEDSGCPEFDQLIVELADMDDLYDEDVMCSDDEADARITAQARRIVELAQVT
jgi:hypothetical protein